jgi:hypothetical protein
MRQLVFVDALLIDKGIHSDELAAERALISLEIVNEALAGFSYLGINSRVVQRVEPCDDILYPLEVCH